MNSPRAAQPRSRHFRAPRPVLRPLASALLLAMASQVALAQTLPAGPNVTSGSATFTTPSTGQLNITQSTQGVIINWKGFSIGAGGTVTFQQPNAQAVALNRVLGRVPSDIAGTLNANGRVFLVNPSGVLFSSTAQVNVGGLVASTLGITDEAFNSGVESGHFVFSGGGGSVSNFGTINAADGGTVALLGDGAQNFGIITARLGSIVMGSGSAATLDFFGDGLTQIVINGDVTDGEVNNEGTLRADGGQVTLAALADGDGDGLALVHSGLIQARTLENRAGRVILTGGTGGVRVGGGLIDATGQEAGQAGGSIEVVGGTVDIDDLIGRPGACEPCSYRTASLDTSGMAGGGSIKVNASGALTASSTLFAADALAGGDGGSIVVSGAQSLTATGVFRARGAGLAGNGGSIDFNSSDGNVALGSLDADVTTWLDASGGTGGGQVLVRASGNAGIAGSGTPADGGGPNTQLRADALAAGNGGQVVVFGNTGSGMIGDALASARGVGSTGIGGRIGFGGNLVTFYNADLFSDFDGAARLDASGDAGGGRILLAGNGVVFSHGMAFDASARTSGMGGQIQLLGGAVGANPFVRVLDNSGSSFIATGPDGGGSIELHASGVLALTSGDTFDASATGTGDGGTIRALGDQGLRAYGSFTARGGAGGGDGGLVETSSAGLDLNGIRVDAGAPAGTAGLWLVDPFNVDIVSGSASGSLTGNPYDPVASSTIQDGDINAALNSGTNVQITTGAAGAGNALDGYINIEPGVLIDYNALTTPLSFRLDANAAISGNGFEIRSTGGPLDVIFNSNANNLNPEGGYISLTDATLATNGGNISFFGQSDAVNGVASGYENGIELTDVSMDTRVGQSDANAGGDIRLRGHSYATDAGPFAAGVRMEGVGLATSTGSIDIAGTGDAINGVLLLNGFVVGTSALIPVPSVISTTTGDIRITGQAIGASSAAFGVGVVDSFVGTESGTIDLRGHADDQGIGLGLAGSSGPIVGGAQIVVGGAGRLFLTGESTGGGAGLLLNANTQLDGGDGDIVLRAGNDGSSDAIVLGGSIATAGTVNLRPGGVDAGGNAYERGGDAITLGDAPGFSISATELAGISAPNVVVGSDVQTGRIDVQTAIARSGNLTLQSGGAGAAGIGVNAAIDVGTGTLALVSDGSITQTAAITANSLLARSASGSVVLTHAGNNVAGTTLAGSAAGDFRYTDADALAIGTVAASGYDAAGNTTTALAATGIDAGGDAFVRTLSGDLTLNAGVSAGNDIDLVAAGLFQNPAAAALAAGGQWRVWASTWLGENRGGLAGSGTLPNLYNCSFAGACGVTVPTADNHFIYAAQPVATIAIDDATREYGLANPAFGFTIGGMILGDQAANALTGAPATTATQTSNVGDYAIDGSWSSPAGYAIDLQPGTLAITPATLTYIADPFTRLYGDPNGTLSGTVTGFRNGETLATATTGTLGFTSTAGPTSNVGYYAINGSGLAARNYVFVQSASNATALRIDPATLTYVANPFTRLYGDPNGTLGGTVTGFRNNETVATATTGTLVFTSTAGPTSNVGNYAIDGSGLAATNYVFVQADSNATALRIDPATLTYVANPFTRLYGDPNGTLGGTVTGFRNGETVATATTGTLAFTSTAGATSNVGNYAIDGSGLAATNYVFVQADSNATALRIDPATLTYVADPFTRFVGDPNGTLGGTVTGFRNGETLATATTGTLSFDSTAGQFSPVGVYAIDGSGLQATNYVFEQAPQNATALTVLGRPSVFIPEVVRDPPDNYVYDRNLGTPAMCLVTDLLAEARTRDGDPLAREWSKVRSRPNLMSCVQSNKRNGCADF